MQSFIAPKRLLLGPGPTNTSDHVLAAAAQPTIGHLDPAFQELMEVIKQQLRLAFKTNNQMTFPISAPGSVAMETALVNLIEPGDKVIVAQNGVFGGRMADIVKRSGGQLVHLNFDWGKEIYVLEVENAINANKDAKILAFVHAETSTGVQSDALALCRLATNANILSIVDTVTGLGGIEVNVDEWGADIVYSGSQKCLAVPPGLAPITFSPKAIAAIEDRKTPCQSWFMDLGLVLGYWRGGHNQARSYHHTAPVNALYGLHEGLRLLLDEGIEQSIKRHLTAHNELEAGLKKLGLESPVDETVRLPQLNIVNIPENVKDTDFRSRLLNDYGIEIGAGLGIFAGKVWRIGLMGPNASTTTVTRLLHALENLFTDLG